MTNEKAAVAARRMLPIMEENGAAAASMVAKRASCKRGCHHCCFNYVEISLGEGTLIADYLRRSPAWQHELPALRRRLIDEANGVATMEGDVTAVYLAKKMPCVFLDKATGDCRIYDLRPMACRFYWVATPAEYCSPDKVGAPVGRYDLVGLMADTIAQTIAETQDVIPLYTGVMQLMVLAGFVLLEKKPADFRAWAKKRRLGVKDTAGLTSPTVFR